VVKWLLDAGASIHADADGKNVEDKKPCDKSVANNVADGDTVAPRGIGRKAVRDAVTKHPLLIRNLRVTPKFSKRVLSVSKLIDDGHQVEFAKEHAMARDKSGKVVKCPRDKKSGLCYPHTFGRSETVNCAGKEEPNWKNIVQKVDPATGIDAVKKVVEKLPKTVDLNEAHDVCGHEGEALLRKTHKRLGVELTGALKPCKGCGHTKARAKAASKTATTKAAEPGERLFLDASGPFTPALNGCKHWTQVADNFTRHGFYDDAGSKIHLSFRWASVFPRSQTKGKETRTVLFWRIQDWAW
jgi:hypothetical protein